MGSTSVSAPSTPQAPSTADAINAWVQSMPQVFETQMKYAPQEAAQQVELAQQYAQPLAQAYKTAQEGLYPNETKLSNQLTEQAMAGMQNGVPDWMQQQYRSDMNAQLGNNVNAPIGADYASRGLLQQAQDWQRYYQNMGLSIAGKQPTAQAQGAQTSNYMSGYTPQSVMNYTNQGYGSYANAYANMYGTNQQAQGLQNQLYGSLIGGVGAAGGGLMSNPFFLL